MIHHFTRTRFVACVNLIVMGLTILFGQISNSSPSIGTNQQGTACSELLKTPNHSEVIYIGRITLKPKVEIASAERSLKALVADWLSKSAPEISDALPLDKFVESFDRKVGSTLIASQNSQIRGELGAMERIWVTALERTSTSGNHRHRVEVTLQTRADGSRMDMIITVTSWISNPETQPTSSRTNPNLFSKIIEPNAYWTIIDRPQIRQINSESKDIQDFIKLLSKESRRPIIYVTRKKTSGEFAIPPQLLHDYFGGQADVFFDGDTLVRSLVYKNLPEQYHAWDGAISIFFPNVSINDPQDSRRHEFIHTGFNSQIQTLERIRKALTPHTLHVLRNRTRGLLAVLQAEAQLAQSTLAAQRSSTVDHEYQTLLEEELQTVQGALAAARAKESALLEQLIEAQERVELLEGEIKRLNARDSLSRTNAERIRAAEFPMTLARTPVEALEFFRDHFSDKLVVTERALKSARNTSFKNARIAWEILASLTFKLYALYFDQVIPISAQKIANEFLTSTGYEYSVSEGRHTNANPHYSSLRELQYQNQTVSIDPHIKYGNREPDLIRVHIYIDRDNKKIVIGHFGDHLENRATRSQ